jgi:FemAB-related protein (PEP-CTERM system-associated)
VKALAMKVELFQGLAQEWDGFVETSPHGTFFHLLGWRDVLEQAFGFRTHYLAARHDGRLAGVLPLCEVPSGLRGRCLLSLPFAVEAGVCAVDDAARRALDGAAAALCGQRGTAYVELRDGLDADGFQQREGTYYRFRRTLHATEEENFAAIPRKQRRMIRVGQRHGLTAGWQASDVRVFHDLYARTVRRLGTPVFSPGYFRLLLDTFRGRCEILTVYSEERPVAAVLSFFFGDTVMPYYAGSRPESYRLAANDVMYWELMREACRKGLRRFDFGRSKKATGAFDFKRHWGFDAEPLRYRVLTPTGQPFAERTINDGGVKLLRWAWSRLPLALTKVLGPPLVRRFGPLYT